jgi:hypothetical protein
MEKYEPACPWHIRVGDLFIAPGRVPNCGTVWVGEVNGEGGKELPTDQLAEMLQRFYTEAA